VSRPGCGTGELWNYARVEGTHMHSWLKVEKLEEVLIIAMCRITQFVVKGSNM
jgi:hypothetical protein